MSHHPQNQDSSDQDSLGEKLKAAFDSNNSDKDHNALKALISSVPAVGSLVISLYESRVVDPATQRVYNFLETLVREFEKLKSQIELVDFGSPAFETTIIRASDIASRTHQEQKLEALRNIVLNSSIPRSLEYDILAMFLNWIDDFTELHISILTHLHYLDRYAPEQLQIYFPMLEQKKFIYNKVLKDLADQGLISLREDYFTVEDDDDMSLRSLGMIMPQSPVDMYSQTKKNGEKEIKLKTFIRREDINSLLKKNRSSTQASKTTELGKQFIEFIEYPSI
jgi:hypothetical protein